MSLPNLPNEILKSIWDNLVSRHQKNSLIQSSRQLHSALNIYLYRDAVQHDPLSVSRWAAKHGREDTLEKLVKEGLDFKDDPSMMLLFEAARYGRDGVIRFLIRHGVTDLDIKENRGHNGGSALSLAVLMGRESVVRLLLRHRVDLESRNLFWETPLLTAVKCGYAQLALLLLEERADPDVEDAQGRTTLWHAVNGSNVEIIRLLIDRLPKCRIDRGVMNGTTPLLRAIELNNTQAARLLLEAGAQVDPLSKMDLPFGSVEDDLWARLHGLTSAQARLIRQSFSAVGCDIDKRHGTALQMAIYHNLIGIVRLILDEGIVTQESGSYAVAWATSRGNQEMVELLLQEYVDPQYPKALLFAAMHGLEGIAERILEVSAEPNPSSRPGVSPLDWAVRRGHYGVVALLVERGADLEQQKRKDLLVHAIQTKDSRLFRALFKDVDMEQEEYQTLQPLLRACAWLDVQ